MISYAARRLALFLPMLLGIAVVVFFLMKLIPGDPATVYLGEQATPEAVARLRTALGLDRPLPVQLAIYLGNLLTGDLGQSIFQSQPVVAALLGRLGATVELAVAALIVSVAVGILLGVLAAVRQGSIWDVGAMLFAQLGVSMPVFWLGILLMLLFAVQLNWLPAIGRGAPLTDAVAEALVGRPGALVDALRHLALPALALGLNGAAIMSRLVRSAMLEVLHQDFVRTAYAKGVPRRRVVFGHALRNALLPVISVIGLQFGVLLGGAVLTETIFGWPGLGQMIVTAISQRDFPLVQGAVLFFGLMFALVNLAVDLAYGIIDPRIRFR